MARLTGRSEWWVKDKVLKGIITPERDTHATRGAPYIYTEVDLNRLLEWKELHGAER